MGCDFEYYICNIETAKQFENGEIADGYSMFSEPGFEISRHNSEIPYSATLDRDDLKSYIRNINEKLLESSSESENESENESDDEYHQYSSYREHRNTSDLTEALTVYTWLLNELRSYPKGYVVMIEYN